MGQVSANDSLPERNMAVCAPGDGTISLPRIPITNEVHSEPTLGVNLWGWFEREAWREVSMFCLPPDAASTSPANKTPNSTFMRKTPPQTKKSFPQVWELIPQTSPTFPQAWGFNGDTWGISGEAWGRVVEAGPTFPHVPKLGAVS